jgi:hypothetical protein
MLKDHLPALQQPPPLMLYDHQIGYEASTAIYRAYVLAAKPEIYRHHAVPVVEVTATGQEIGALVTPVRNRAPAAEAVIAAGAAYHVPMTAPEVGEHDMFADIAAFDAVSFDPSRHAVRKRAAPQQKSGSVAVSAKTSRGEGWPP